MAGDAKQSSGYGTVEEGRAAAGAAAAPGPGAAAIATAIATDDEDSDEAHYIGDAANINLLQCWQRLDYWWVLPLRFTLCYSGSGCPLPPPLLCCSSPAAVSMFACARSPLLGPETRNPKPA